MTNAVDDRNFVVIWEAPTKVDPVEFRLYYDDQGNVLFYTCDKPEGNYIVVDKTVYAEARPDLKVVDGAISRLSTRAVVYKLMPSDNGINCVSEDLSIIPSANYRGKTTKWKLIAYEL